MIPNMDGLAYAGGEWDASKYAPFDVDKDKIILICEAERKADHLAGTGEPTRKRFITLPTR